jgi:hypothetical protein
VASQHFVRYWNNNGQKPILARHGLSANDVVDGAYSAASPYSRPVIGEIKLHILNHGRLTECLQTERS